MRAKATTIKELSTTLHNDLIAYLEFEKVYGTVDNKEQIAKRNAISSLISELPWHETFDEIVEAINNRELFDDYKNEEVYKFMLRYMKHNTVSK